MLSIANNFERRWRSAQGPSRILAYSVFYELLHKFEYRSNSAMNYGRWSSNWRTRNCDRRHVCASRHTVLLSLFLMYQNCRLLARNNVDIQQHCTTVSPAQILVESQLYNRSEPPDPDVKRFLGLNDFCWTLSVRAAPGEEWAQSP